MIGRFDSQFALKADELNNLPVQCWNDDKTMLIMTSRQEVKRYLKRLAAFGLTIPPGGIPIYFHEPYGFVLPNQWRIQTLR